jgi:nicotinate-nucleotide adenylyltransferase
VSERRLGLFGGTFDPIHYGHMAIARFVKNAVELESVCLITAARPPHKGESGHAGATDRHRMVELAAEGDPSLIPTDLELRRTGPSYTVDTVRAFRRHEPEARLFFVVGGDTIDELPSWYRLEEIVRLVQVVTVTRPGSPDRYDPDRCGGLAPEIVGRLNRFVLTMPPRHESSTEVRRRIARGEPFEHLVPPAVAAYIRKRGLYRAPSSGVDSRIP